MDMKTAVIYRLEELIRQKDITVNEAAIRSGVPPSTLKNILYSEPCSPGSGRHQNSGHSGSQSAQPVLWDAPESCDCIGRGD